MSEAHAEAVHAHHAPTGFIRKYIFSLDHKVIGKQYYFLALISVVVGIILSVFMRLHMVWPTAHIPWLDKLSPAGAPGGVITPEYYLSLMTLHGTLMVFFVLTTAPQSGFGNYVAAHPDRRGRHGFPDTQHALVLDHLCWLRRASRDILHYRRSASVRVDELPSAQRGRVRRGAGRGFRSDAVDRFHRHLLRRLAAGRAEFYRYYTGPARARNVPDTYAANGVGVVHHRGPGSACRSRCCLPPAYCCFSIASVARVSSSPAGSIISDKIISNHSGGSALLWQHLFWFFGHPEVYIAILPGMGITSHILSTFSRKPIFGYKAMVYAMMAIGFFGFMVWGHHMFLSGMSPYSGFAFSVMTMAIGVPSAIKTFNWLGTLWGGRLRFTTAMLFAVGFVSLFVSGGLSGLFLAQPPVDVPLHATYFVPAHFHLVMGVAAIFGMFAGTFFWFPKMFGRMMNETLGKIHFWLTFVGVYCIFMPMHFLGLEGNVRRYSQFDQVNFLNTPHIMNLHAFISIAAFITAGAQLIFLANLFCSLFWGPKASDNPWEATSLEWTVPSPPPFDNFGGKHPVVHHGAYEFGVPGAAKDYIMQDSTEIVAEEG